MAPVLLEVPAIFLTLLPHSEYLLVHISFVDTVQSQNAPILTLQYRLLLLSAVLLP